MTVALENFKIAAISSNTNSFGLKEFIMGAQNGTTYKACKYNSIGYFKVGDIVEVPVNENLIPQFGMRGFEIPRKVDNCPPKVVKEIWKS